MKQSNQKTKTGLIILAITWLNMACVSSPNEQQPEAIEAANNDLSTGVNHYNDSKHELAISYFKNALHDFRSIDHQYGIASSCLNLSKSYLSIGDIDTADAYIKQAQRIIKRENIKQLNHHLRIIESSIAIENGQLSQAQEILHPLLTSDNSNAFTLAAIQNRTRIAHASNDKAEATQWTNTFEQKIKSSSNNQTYKARLARFKASLSDDTKTQNQYFDEALNMYRSQTNRPGIAATLQEWGDALIAQDQMESARDKLLRALYIRQSLQDRNNSLKTLNSLAVIFNDEKTGTWIGRLRNKHFKKWDEFIAAFSLFPA
ncbi:MAG: hypothetical protein OQK32_00540 [Gammaproteobacteria bacterium]|nr:hypothetical protein [Gammaproteobacteria bacterium]MCW8923986.1 hypothetical protein [Gammaproteobacteria bacterium]